MLRSLTTCCLALLLIGPALAQDVPTVEPVADPKTTTDDGSYAIGINIGISLRSDSLRLNSEKLVQGLLEGIKGAEPKMTEQQRRQAITALVAMSNKLAGEEYLAANTKKEGVVTLDSGLQYKVIKAGNGARPKATDLVTTHYEGTLIDGTVFDSSIARGEPAKFPVNGVIKGWTEALQKMKVGDKWQLFIPSNLAYGTRGAGGQIGPNSTLIFQIELLAVEPAPAPDPNP